ncbi:MAG TPA: hypothetical protein VLZ12_03900 [Verrucomicrobiae bacterium]|nr:hypothetical protein [Verrucomicrobiae bacterium]
MSDDQPNPPEETTAKSAAPEAPLDLASAVWQLRVLVCGLGAALLVSSITFNVFVWKQNRNISSQTNARTSQLARLQATQDRLKPALNELAHYSVGKPDLMAVFNRFGLDIVQPSAETSAPPVAVPQAQ